MGADDDVNKIFKRLQSRAEPPTTFKSSPGQMSGAPVEQLDDTCHGTLMSFSLTIRSAKEKEKKTSSQKCRQTDDGILVLTCVCVDCQKDTIAPVK